MRFYNVSGNLISTSTDRELQRADRQRQEKEQVQTALQELRDRVAWL